MHAQKRAALPAARMQNHVAAADVSAEQRLLVAASPGSAIKRANLEHMHPRSRVSDGFISAQAVTTPPLVVFTSGAVAGPPLSFEELRHRLPAGDEPPPTDG